MKPASCSLYRLLPGKRKPPPRCLSSALRKTGSVRGSLPQQQARWRRCFLSVCKDFVSDLITKEKSESYQKLIILEMRHGTSAKINVRWADLASQKRLLCAPGSKSRSDDFRTRKAEGNNHLCNTRKCLVHWFFPPLLYTEREGIIENIETLGAGQVVHADWS